ncbi:MAG: bifunctional DNA-formamidopyrimidine glycosylase/DNA-(apurinic or apyrimidinic site) lyase [Candidatus Acidiferrales bacterium]
MPELPEVETVVRGLQAVLPGRQILSIRLGKTDFIDDPVLLAAELPGRRIAGVSRYGKFISVEFVPAAPAEHPETRLTLVVHLGMTGRITTGRPSEPVPPHTHVFLALDDGNELRYTDIRRFGRIRLVPDAWMNALRARWGEDALEISTADFVRQIGSRGARIKALLLDQHAVRGIGNIYADESLWRARIHPARRADSLSAEQLRALHGAIQAILLAAIKLRGSSFSDYVDAEGKPGAFQRMHRVYQKEGRACRRCGQSIRRTQVAGRSSFFCPRCQPAPRARKKSGTRKKKSHK